MKYRSHNFYAIVDTEGYILVLTRNLRLKTRIYTNGKDIKNIVVIKDILAIVHQSDIAFSKLLDDQIYPWYCEGSFSGEYDLTSIVVPESYRTQ